MRFDQAKPTFILECQEQLEAMEQALLRVEEEADPTESIHAIFRAVHTLKGSSGLFGLDPVVRFAHSVESVMDRVRGGKLALSPALVGLLLESHDHLEALVATTQEGVAEGAESRELGQRLLDALAPFLEAPGALVQGLTSAVPGSAGDEPGEGVRNECWHVSIRFGPDVLRNGMDPVSFLRYLGSLGRIAHLASMLERMPLGDAYDPEACYLGLELDLDTDAERQAIDDAFEFVLGDSQIRLFAPHSKLEDYLTFLRSMPEEKQCLGEILVAGNCLTRRELEDALLLQKSEADGAGPGRRIGDILIERHDVPPPLVAAALARQRTFHEHQAQDARVIKVQADKLDRLVDLVGELVIAGATANACAAATHDGPMLEAAVVLEKLVEEIRDTALGLRMVQIGETFSRFRRVVRDVSRELGKLIELEIHGAEAELDKSIVEKLADPLMHIVRNAIDHGIEPPELRLARGKPEAGSLALNAFHDSGNIVIEISDDGGGLDKPRILAKACERGLVEEGAELTDAEITNLIFQPGFSTAEAVTSLSGRGVGMDVVRRNLDELRGTIDVESYEGSGTTLRIRLPLTLAIIDGFRVEVAGAAYVIPLDRVIECLDLGPFLASEANHMLNLRGEVLPFLRLREVFRLDGAVPARERVVVVQHGGDRAGIVVDRLLGSFQTVIKPLGPLFRRVQGLGGSTILGSGEVALILDVPQLIQLAAGRPSFSNPFNAR